MAPLHGCHSAHERLESRVGLSPCARGVVGSEIDGAVMEAGRPDVEMLEDRLINWFGKNHGDDPQC